MNWDDLKWDNDPPVMADITQAAKYHVIFDNGDGTYDIYKSTAGCMYSNIDAITAQAIIYHLTHQVTEEGNEHGGR